MGYSTRMYEGQREHCGGKRVNILLFKDQISNIFEQLKFEISRMEFEKLKFEILRMKKLGISEIEFKWENKPILLLCFNDGIYWYYKILIMEFIEF